MIDKKTVFIIGAGSNILYGFPSGRKLRNNIIYNFQSDIGNLRKILPSGYYSSAKAFVNEFKESNIQSIDKFITLRPEFNEIGKFAIAIEILKSEKDSVFTEDLELNNFSKDWYFYLYNKMIEDIDCKEDYSKFKNNTISFITFNYDRSLEYYLYNSFVHSFPPELLKRTEIEDIFPFQIIHVYGTPRLQWQDKSNYLDYCRNFEYDERTVYNIQKMVDSIKIIYDERNSEESILRAQKCLINSEKVFFLGFGYAKENLEILGIPDKLKDKDVYGTALRNTENEISKIVELLGLELNPSKNTLRVGDNAKYCILDNVDCMMLLNNYL